jgi:hypothetical protein
MSDLQYQAEAAATDQAVSLMLAHAESRGISPEVICSGALHAVIRYHIKHMTCVRAPRPILAILYPSVGGVVDAILRSAEAAEAQAEADAHVKN